MMNVILSEAKDPRPGESDSLERGSFTSLSMTGEGYRKAPATHSPT